MLHTTKYPLISIKSENKIHYYFNFNLKFAIFTKLRSNNYSQLSRYKNSSEQSLFLAETETCLCHLCRINKSLTDFSSLKKENCMTKLINLKGNVYISGKYTLKFIPNVN